jgi:hypothetical protein
LVGVFLVNDGIMAGLCAFSKIPEMQTVRATHKPFCFANGEPFSFIDGSGYTILFLQQVKKFLARST